MAVIELVERSCSNLDEMVEVPVFDPWRKPLKEDSWTAAEVEDIMVLVADSWVEAVRDNIDEAKLFPPMAWLAIA